MENEGRIIDECQAAPVEGADSVFRAVCTRVQVRLKVARRPEKSFARNTVHVSVLLPVMLVQAKVVLEDLVTRATVSMVVFVMIL